MNELLNGPFFFTGLCLIVYLLACRLQRITRKTWLNPLLVSILVLIGILSVLRIPYAHFKEGSSVIAMMLTPATCVLAIPMYNQRKILKQNLAAILIGTFLGALSSILSVTLLCRIFGLNELITRSLLPKSVTTPIAVSVCEVRSSIPMIRSWIRPEAAPAPPWPSPPSLCRFPLVRKPTVRLFPQPATTPWRRSSRRWG